MTIQEKITWLEEIMDVEEGSLSEDTVLADVEEWDSLSTLSLTVEMKNRYGINLTTAEIKGFVTVSDVCAIIPDEG